MSRSPTLPSPRLHLADLIRVAMDPGVSHAVLAKRCASEPGVTMELLRVGNSARFGFIRPIRSARQAVVALGIRQVRAVIIAHVIRAAFADCKIDMDLDLLWEDCLRRGCAARLVAQLTWYEDPEEAFATGLAQDLGTALLAIEHRDLGPALQALRSHPSDVRLAEERKLCGSDHVDAFARSELAKVLPQDLVAAVVHHHHPEGSERSGRLAQVARCADVVADLIQVEDKAPAVAIATEVLRQAQVKWPLIEVLDQLAEQMETMSSDLNIPVHEQPDLTELIREASEAVIALGEELEDPFLDQVVQRKSS